MLPARVGVVGDDLLAAQWCARLLARGCDVVLVDRSDGGLAEHVREAWNHSLRLGTFPGATIDRLRAARSLGDLAGSALVVVSMSVGEDSIVAEAVQTVPGARVVAQRSAGHGAVRATACDPAHLVPLVEVEGPWADVASGLCRDLGMHPVPAPATEGAHAEFGDGLARAAGRDPSAVLAVLRALRATSTGAGRALAEWEARTLDSGAPRWRPGDAVPAPLRLWSAPVNPDWVDYNGHMTEAAYLTAFGWASDALFRYVGDDEEYRAGGHSLYTVETHIVYEREASVHEPLEVSTQVLGTDAKRLHFFHSMHRAGSGERLATCEQMLVHVDMGAGRSCPMLPALAEALSAVAASHAALDRPAEVGRTMSIPSRR